MLSTVLGMRLVYPGWYREGYTQGGTPTMVPREATPLHIHHLGGYPPWYIRHLGGYHPGIYHPWEASTWYTHHGRLVHPGIPTMVG